MSDEFPEIGEVFEENYRLKSIIGEGGFARIYRAVQLDLEREVALKILDPSVQDHDEYETNVERFKREAQLLAKLRDPHTITLHDHGKTEGDLWYLVFEYVDGRSLKEIVDETGGIAPARVVKIVRQVAMSLQEAHAGGVLHRDIKPANIMVYDHVGRSDQVKVLDFGIAKAVLADEEEAQNDVTQTGALLGTPRYMSPEQLEDHEDIGPASDLYCLGLVSYELLTGKRAVQGSGFAEIVKEHLVGPSLRLPPGSELSAGLRRVVDRMLAKRVEHRFSEAEELLESLEGLEAEQLRDEPVEFVGAVGDEAGTPAEAAATEVEPFDDTVVGTSGRRGDRGAREEDAVRRTVSEGDATTAPAPRTEGNGQGSVRLRYAFGAVAVLLAVAGLAWGMFRGSTSAPEPEERSAAERTPSSSVSDDEAVKVRPTPQVEGRGEGASNRERDAGREETATESAANPIEGDAPPESESAASEPPESEPAEETKPEPEDERRREKPSGPPTEASDDSAADESVDDESHVETRGESGAEVAETTDGEVSAGETDRGGSEPAEQSDTPSNEQQGAAEESDDSTFIDLTEIEGD